MPLFYYGTWEPGKNHAWDTLLFAAALGLLLPYAQSDFSDRRLLVAIAAVLGFAVTIPYYSAAVGVVLAIALLVTGCFRHAVVLVAIGSATRARLLVVPLSVGAPSTERLRLVRLARFAPRRLIP